MFTIYYVDDLYRLLSRAFVGLVRCPNRILDCHESVSLPSVKLLNTQCMRCGNIYCVGNKVHKRFSYLTYFVWTQWPSIEIKGLRRCIIQSRAVITGSNSSQNCNCSSRASIRLGTHNRQPIPRPGELWADSCEVVGENWPLYNGTAL